MLDKTRKRLLYSLKSRGPQTASQLAKEHSITSVGARQHLDGLLNEDLVTFEDQKGNVGRPRRIWALSDKGNKQFPDNHSGLLIDMLNSIREVYGQEGIDKLIEKRERDSFKTYSEQVLASFSFKERVEALREQRSAEGYMAEVEEMEDGSLLFIENHCSICAAATACQNFCRSELKLFRDILGKDCRVERLEHIVSGARRCTYKIQELGKTNSAP
ncbi:helix-turn-helix transcriptional regulator [Flexibacterium corallicola]|uniref:helix-turn-helix transcriptional regulator n=1 Tax=Flexibacterium corallicola TaxID=3037259 RepID=UPI00286F9CCE|nr:metalloregulator ArsR/SmtB family transcription factor [Pseudovibrio sp. M1P-2-3]